MFKNIKPLSSSKGFTLIELLLSMVFGLIVLSGVIYVYLAVIVSSSETLKSTKLNTQLMTMMSIMVNDVRRAGFWGNPDALPSADNPFNVDNDTLLTIFSNATASVDENTNTDGYCLLFSYDKNGDGSVDAAGDVEYFGFRFSRSDGTVEMAVNSAQVPAITCSGGTWFPLSDPDLIEITSLTFNPAESACVNSSEPDGFDSASDADSTVDDVGEKDCYTVAPTAGHITVETREILITLTGRLKSDSEVTAKIKQTVRVRNDVVRVRA
ncbi:hypothetical protein RGQ13_04970 [Thalassotalea psychrophila]|uniref:Prepilin-type N-terminal cleavage/methylation domain-containing protein n=1 Tax=Thalassotalea psychrophila TaxID=3065647 RepID=A0ABY9TWX8_9GAMM|nr:hypothetical protein RGQ13_04970 [Colwelliaceae bacterium SQ149]